MRSVSMICWHGFSISNREFASHISFCYYIPHGFSRYIREITGKKVRTLRKEGLIPAELYGRGIKNVHLAVPVKEFNKVLKEAGTTTVITLTLGKENTPP